MNEPINQIVGVLNKALHPLSQNREPRSSLADSKVNDQETLHKYKMENNLIVYEK
jgi:hypothetical protein